MPLEIFAPDLFYRINVVRFRLPRLRERKEDIPMLAEYFRALHEKHFAMESMPLSPEMVEYLQNRGWPGNVRELSNGMARHVLVGPEEAFGPTLASQRAVLRSQIKSGGRRGAAEKYCQGRIPRSGTQCDSGFVCARTSGTGARRRRR